MAGWGKGLEEGVGGRCESCRPFLWLEEEDGEVEQQVRPLVRGKVRGGAVVVVSQGRERDE